MATASNPAPHNHLACFYRTRDHLVTNIAEFVACGLRKEFAIAIVCREKLWKAVQSELCEEFNVAEKLGDGLIHFIDVEQAFNIVTSQNGVNYQQFDLFFNSLLKNAKKNRPGLFLYGELAQYLIEKDFYDDAIAIEERANEYLRENPSVTSLCANPVMVLEEPGLSKLRYLHRTCIDECTHTDQKADILKKYRQLQMKYSLLETEKELMPPGLADHIWTNELVHSLKLNQLGELVSGICHEIANPVTIMTGNLMVINSLIDEKQYDHPLLKSNLKNFESAIGRINKIAKSVLKAARPVNFSENCSVCDTINSVLDFVNPQFKEHAIQINYHAHDDVVVKIGQSELIQVLLNLFLNARDAIVEYRSQGSGIIDVYVEKNNHDDVKITVWDNGPGVSPENIEQIFKPFFTTKKGSGLGLGLALSKKILETAKGDLILDKDISRGTKFVITLASVG